MNKKTVVLFKGSGNEYQSSECENDPYLEILNKNGLSASIIPTLQFNYVNKEILVDNLRKADDFSGLIFSSPRAVEAVNQSCVSGPYLSSWKSKDNYSVGKATANLARTLLDLETVGEETGSAKKLCDFILSHSDSVSTFLFPCSNIRKDTIPKLLSENGIKVIEVVSYETVANSALADYWKKLVSENGIPEILIYFSPSGVQYSHTIIQSTYIDCHPKIIAVGPVTAQALMEKFISPAKICNCPTPESVLDAVKCVISEYDS